MRILIVEDETAAYENLADMLVTIDPTLEIMGNTESVQQTVRWLQAPSLCQMSSNVPPISNKTVVSISVILLSYFVTRSI